VPAPRRTEHGPAQRCRQGRYRRIEPTPGSGKSSRGASRARGSTRARRWHFNATLPVGTGLLLGCAASPAPKGFAGFAAHSKNRSRRADVARRQEPTQPCSTRGARATPRDSPVAEGDGEGIVQQTSIAAAHAERLAVGGRRRQLELRQVHCHVPLMVASGRQPPRRARTAMSISRLSPTVARRIVSADFPLISTPRREFLNWRRRIFVRKSGLEKGPFRLSGIGWQWGRSVAFRRCFRRREQQGSSPGGR
jgi:hypothetical protein